uniref:Innexin n=1 Tax=Brugia malayi TaxID=6279 RepID=A0A0H5SBJ0_BRUMA|nr:BMA-INX-15 [Brugia malayi]
MDKLSIVIESLTKPRYEEDFVDRLNYHITTLILLIAAFTIIAKEYGGDPIQCWLPAELASQKSWEQYAEDYCFVENTYYIPLEQNMPQSEKHRDERLITYYQVRASTHSFVSCGLVFCLDQFGWIGMLV